MNRINITLPDSILNRIDKMAKRENKSRSEFVRRAIRVYERYIVEEEKRRKNILKAIAIQDKLRERTSPWDAVSELRLQRNKNR